MADQKLTQLTTLSLSESGDLLYIVDDATGTPISKGITVEDFFKVPVNVFIGDETTKSLSFLDSLLKVSATGTDQRSGIELTGNLSTDGVNSAIAFFHPSSLEAQKRTCQVSINRLGTDSGASWNVAVANSVGSLSNRFTLTSELGSFTVPIEVPSGSVGGYTKIADLGTNGTTADADSARELEINAGAYTASTTLTVSNVTNLQRFSMQITNTNANVLTFSGITLYFKSDDLPDGVTFATNALTFPVDSAVKYNIVGVAFDGSTFDCKIEIR